jgi:RNA polymerase sigma-70 factor (ECF subfamily)
MKTTPAEQELISAIAKHDAPGAALLYDQYADTLFKVICCSVTDRKIAMDVLEETMQYIWNNCRDCHKEDKTLLLWMAGVARQMARKRIQKQGE